MFIYYSLLLLIISSVIIYDINGRIKNKTKVFNLICLFMIAVVSFSYKIGIDTSIYMDFYEQVGDLSEFDFSRINDYLFEPLYVLLNMIAKTLNLNWIGFKIVCTLLLNCFVFKLFWKYSKYPFSALLLYYLLYWLIMNFESIRQSCGLGFYVWGCMSLIEKDRRGFLVKSIPTMLFHQSGLLIVPLTYILSRYEIKRWHLIFVFVLLAISVVSATFFSDLILIFNYFSSDIGGSYEDYIQTSNSTGLVRVRNFSGIIIPLLVKIIVPSYLCSYYIKHNNQWLARFLFMFASFATMQYSLSIVSRMMQYVAFFYIIGLLDYIIPQLKCKKYSLMCVVVLFSLLLNIYATNVNYFRSDNYFSVNGKDIRYFPYKSILSSKKELPERNKFQRTLYSIYE